MSSICITSLTARQSSPLSCPWVDNVPTVSDSARTRSSFPWNASWLLQGTTLQLLTELSSHFFIPFKGTPSQSLFHHCCRSSVVGVLHSCVHHLQVAVSQTNRPISKNFLRLQSQIRSSSRPLSTTSLCSQLSPSARPTIDLVLDCNYVSAITRRFGNFNSPGIWELIHNSFSISQGREADTLRSVYSQ